MKNTAGTPSPQVLTRLKCSSRHGGILVIQTEPTEHGFTLQQVSQIAYSPDLHNPATMADFIINQKMMSIVIKSITDL